MSRLFEALPVTLAITALCMIAASCGNTRSVAQIRVINAIPDSQPTDIYINNTRVASSLAFGAVYPAQASKANYETLIPGNEKIEGFAPGDTTNPIAPIGTLALNGSTQYTIIAVGLELNESAPLVLADTNTAPMAGNLEFRIVNAAVSSPLGGVDVYFVPPGADLTQFTPQISALGYGQASPYEPIPFQAGGYSVIVTRNGAKTPIVTLASTAAAGSITTIVLLDNSGGNNGISQTPLVLNDLE
jgi:Domain of unknown function (DUF4397)